MPRSPESSSHSNFTDARRAMQINAGGTDQERFDRMLRGKFKRVAAGNFTSRLPGVKSITIAPIKPADPEAEPSQLFATVFYDQPNGKQASSTFAIGADGRIGGEVPRDLQAQRISREQIFGEVIDTAYLVNYNLWRKSRRLVAPEVDETGEARGDGDGEGGEPLPIDPERLHYLEQRPDMLYAEVDERRGFSGYRIALLRRAMVLESPQVGNAAYIFPLPQAVEVDPRRWERPAAERMTDEEGAAELDRRWSPIYQQARTRRQWREMGATRVIHTPGTWPERMDEVFNELNGRAEAVEEQKNTGSSSSG